MTYEEVHNSMSAPSTLEERAPTRKHPIGFVSARTHTVTDIEPVTEPVKQAHPLEGVEAFFAWTTLIGCAAAEGQRRGKALWDEITKARQQPPAPG